MKNKKVLSLLISVIMLFSLAACGQSVAPATTTAPTVTDTPVQPEVPAQSEAEAPAESGTEPGVPAVEEMSVVSPVFTFFGGELTEMGGSGAQVVLNDDGTASGVTGYFGADKVTLWATYTSQTGTWTEADGKIALVFDRQLVSVPVEYTGSKEEGMTVKIGEEEFALVYNADANAFATPDLGEQGGNGVVLQLNEDGSAVATYGYVGGDGITLYAEYSVLSGSFTEADGSITITLNEVSALEISESYSFTAADGFTYAPGGEGGYEVALAE